MTDSIQPHPQGDEPSNQDERRINTDGLPEADADYGADQLEHLSDLEHVRERPSMYIGDTTPRGLHHLVYEVVDNSIDEAMAGFASHISVAINIDGSVTAEDDGRGIPVDHHDQLSEQLDRDVSTLEGVMTVLKFGGKFTKGAYQTSGGLHGVGVTVVNFLSEWCEVDVFRDGHVYHQNTNGVFPRTMCTASGQATRSVRKRLLSPIQISFPTASSTTVRCSGVCENLLFSIAACGSRFPMPAMVRAIHSGTIVGLSNTSNISIAPVSRHIRTSFRLREMWRECG